MRYFILFYIMVFCSLMAFSQEKKGKEPKATPVKSLVKDARTAIKNGRDQKNKEKALLDALKRDGLKNDEKADIYYMAAALEHNLNDQENLKAYLKQKYDTAAYYNTMLLATRYSLLCDSIDTLANEKGKVKPRYRSRNRDLILLYRPNIYLGGRYFLRKGDYAKTYDFMSLYTDLPNQALLDDQAKLQSDTLLVHSNYYCVMSAYNSKHYRNALDYIDSAIELSDSSRKVLLEEYKARCLQELGMKDEWLAQLLHGVKTYARHDFFFTTLAKHYEDNQLYDNCLALSDSMLENVQDATIYWYSKSLMYLHKEQWMKSAEMADVVLEREPEHINALYNKAVSCVNEASDVALKACNDVRKPQYKIDREHIMELYRSARKPSEDLRRLRPDAVTSWAPLLYRIYLNLNLGDEFAEIDKIIRENQKAN